MAGIHKRSVIVRMRGMRRSNHQIQLNHLFDCHAHRQGAVDFHPFDFRDFAMLGQNPQFFQHLV